MSITNITGHEYDDIIIHSPKVVVDFWATWCPPCKAFGPVFEKVSDEITDVEFLKMDVDENPDFSSENGIQSIPTVWFVKDGEKVAEHVGGLEKDDLVQLIQKYLKN